MHCHILQRTRVSLKYAMCPLWTMQLEVEFGSPYVESSRGGRHDRPEQIEDVRIDRLRRDPKCEGRGLRSYSGGRIAGLDCASAQSAAVVSSCDCVIEALARLDGPAPPQDRDRDQVNARAVPHDGRVER